MTAEDEKDMEPSFVPSAVQRATLGPRHVRQQGVVQKASSLSKALDLCKKRYNARLANQCETEVAASKVEGAG